MRTSAVLLLSCAAAPASSLSSGESWPWSRKQALEEAPAKPVALGAVGLKVMVKAPTRAGCWMRMPSGCPNDPMDTAKWRHDTWAEAQGLDEAGCHQRVSIWNGYCGSQDAMMAFVPKESEDRSEPLSALQISATHSWSWPWSQRRADDKQAHPHAVAARDEEQAEKVHTSSIMAARDEEAPVASGDLAAAPVAAERPSLATSTDGKVKMARPTRPGCWMRMASGCPNKPDMQTELWRHDTWAEKHGLDEAACQSRGAVWNGYCGSEDAVMTFVASQ